MSTRIVLKAVSARGQTLASLPVGLCFYGRACAHSRVEISCRSDNKLTDIIHHHSLRSPHGLLFDVCSLYGVAATCRDGSEHLSGSRGGSGMSSGRAPPAEWRVRCNLDLVSRCSPGGNTRDPPTPSLKVTGQSVVELFCTWVDRCCFRSLK